MFDDKSILITGGTGSFGKTAVKRILDRYKPKKLAILSRDELKQHDMRQKFPESKFRCLRYFLGDVRDQKRLLEAFSGMDYIIHTAALKQVPAAEYNPFEAVQTNIIGGQNVIRAAIAQKVKKVVALGTDKAANPLNLYGATKLCSDKLFIAGNFMSGQAKTRFSVVRYGNVFGSRGSVVPLFIKQRKKGVLTVTDDQMTRFSITLNHAVDFVLQNIERMQGGELFVPKIPSYRIRDLAEAIAPNTKIKQIGIRPGEKLHELMISQDNARNTLEYKDHFVIQPDFYKTDQHAKKWRGSKKCPKDFSYTSDQNKEWLSVSQLKQLSAAFEKEYDT